MKRSFFYLAAGVLALSACTSESVLEESKGNVIAFENVVRKNSRAEVTGDITKTNFDHFQVYGYYTPNLLDNEPMQVFYGDDVTLDKTSGDWTYTGERFWVPSATYYFYAYSCADVALANTKGSPSMLASADVDKDNRCLKIQGYVCDNSHQHDLIYAMNEGIKANAKQPEVQAANAKVGFTFNHILTKVSAVFSTDFPEEYDVHISNVKIVNICNIGNYSPKTNPVWAVNRSAANQEVDLAVTAGQDIASYAPETENELKVTTGYAYVLPNNYSAGDVQLKFDIVITRDIEITNGQGEKETKTEKILGKTLVGSWGPNWESGYYYVYNIKISGAASGLEPIVFENSQNMNVGDWKPGTAANINFSAQ